MYSVLRFITEGANKLEKAVKIGEEINSLIPGKYDGLRKVGDGFACSASDNEDWVQHQAEIVEFLRKINSPVSAARVEGIGLILDVAIDSDIKSPMSSYQFSEDLLRSLVERSVGLEISIYNVEAPSPAQEE